MEHILTPCPPRNRCVVCESRLDHAFRLKPRASKAAKYRHQMEWWSRHAITAIQMRAADVAGQYATLAASYAGLMWEEEARAANVEQAS